jgi:hypothetical protein
VDYSDPRARTTARTLAADHRNQAWGREHSTAQDWLERVVSCMIVMSRLLRLNHTWYAYACHSQGCSLVPCQLAVNHVKWSFAVAVSYAPPRNVSQGFPYCRTLYHSAANSIATRVPSFCVVSTADANGGFLISLIASP